MEAQEELIRVVLADDHNGMRETIRLFLELAEDIRVVGEASDGHQALSLVAETSPDVLLLDVEMSGLDGIHVAMRMKAGESPTRILALSAYDDREYVSAMLENGASGYLLKEEIPSLLVPAVRAVARGEHGLISKKLLNGALAGVAPDYWGALQEELHKEDSLLT